MEEAAAIAGTVERLKELDYESKNGVVPLFL